jgi:hypothetical protein
MVFGAHIGAEVGYGSNHSRASLATFSSAGLLEQVASRPPR